MPTAFGLNFETPQQAQERVRQQIMQGFAQQSSDYGRLGYALAGLFRKPDPSIARAKEIQQRIQTAEAASDADVMAAQGYPTGGPEESQLDTEYRRLYAIRNSVGDIAPELVQQIDGQLLTLEQMRVERAKLFAEEQRAAAEFSQKQTQGSLNLAQDVSDALTYHNPTTGEQRAFLKTDAAGIQDAIRSGWIIGADPRRSTETGAAASLAKPTIAKLQDAIIAADHSLDQLAGVGSKWDERWLQYAPQVLMAGSAQLEKLGVKPTAAMLGDRAKYAEFKATAVRGLNDYIRLVTGAAMGKEEEARIRKGFPDSEKDSTTDFVNKTRATVRELLAIRKRAGDALANGITAPEDVQRLATPDVSDSEVDAFMNKAFGFRPAQAQADVKATKSGVKYTVKAK